MSRPKIGLALGSGSARGWAHMGVIQELAAADIVPDIVCGSSAGALVGAAHAHGTLAELESWVRGLTRREMVRMLDLSLAGGGLIEGQRLKDALHAFYGDVVIEDLPTPFVAVACDLTTKREVWLREGSLTDAVRASLALPGIFTPARIGDQWLLDGGLVNPVPVSPCRALGADIVIAVNLTGDLARGHRSHGRASRTTDDRISAPAAWVEKLLNEFPMGLRTVAAAKLGGTARAGDYPGYFDVVLGSIDIMQHRIMQSRLAGDPPDILLMPRLKQFGLLDFSEADEIIEEGRECVRLMRSALDAVLDRA